MSLVPYKIPLTDLAKLVKGESATLWIDEKREVIVIPADQGYEVYSSICPHMGAQMQLDAKSGELVCPWHGLRYCPEQQTSNHHCYRNLKKYKAEVKGDSLEIQP